MIHICILILFVGMYDYSDYTYYYLKQNQLLNETAISYG